MGSPPSRPTPSGRCSTGPATAINSLGPGAPLVPPYGAARPGRRSSPTRMPSPKKLTPPAYPMGETMGPSVRRQADLAGLFLTPAFRPVLGARGRAGSATPRIPPQRHGQSADPVPPRRRAGTRRGRDGLSQRGTAPLAESRADLAVLAGLSDPRPRAVQPTRRLRRCWERWSGWTDYHAHAALRTAALADFCLVLDNLAGHKTPEFVLWLFAHGIMPLYTCSAGRVLAEHGREHPSGS